MLSENVTTDYVFVVIRNRHVEMFTRPWHVPTKQRQILKFIRRERDAHTATIIMVQINAVTLRIMKRRIYAYVILCV